MYSKAEFKASTFLYSMALVIGIFSILFAFSSKLLVTYNVAIPLEYNKTFNALANSTQFDSLTSDLKESALNEGNTTKSKLAETLDILGSYFERGYQTLQLVPRTIDIFSIMVGSVLTSNVIIFGIAIEPLRFIIISLIALAITFLVLKAVVKWEI